MPEYPSHKRAKQRIFQLLLARPEFTSVALEKQMHFGVRGFNYVADIFAARRVEGIVTNCLSFDYVQFCIEIDGKHHPPRKNKERDRAFAEHGIKTIRFDTSSIIGKKAVPDETILAEILYRLKQKEALMT